MHAIVWSSFSGMEESFCKIIRENFGTLSMIFQLQLQRVSRLCQRLDRKQVDILISKNQALQILYL